MADITTQINALNEAYTDAYDAAYKSISGQYGLWETAADVIPTSVGTISAALESQTVYWQNYNANLESLSARTGDIEGLSEMISTFADGSADSVNAIAGMAGATDDELKTMVANWQSLQKEQQTASESLADLTTGFTEAMDDIEQEVTDTVAAMDLGDEALSAGQSIIQNFIDGATELMPQVQSAYNRIANVAQNALSAARNVSTASDSDKYEPIGHYAGGTSAAKAGYAIVGEYGPELVYFNGGEQVITATETAAIQDGIQMVTVAPQLLSALSQPEVLETEYGASGGVSISVDFHISGNADTETIAALRDYGDDFAERVLSVISDAGVDTERGRY